MKTASKFVSALMAIIMTFLCIGVTSYAANTPNATIKGMVITQLPKQRSFFINTDWKYGYWNFPEGKDTGDFVSSNKYISFMYNGGKHTHYEDRGMLDMNGLKVKVTYSDGSTKDVAFSETVSGNYVSQNILASPSGGDFKLGQNTIEIYFSQNTSVYTTYTINILDGILGDVNNDSKVNSSDALIVLKHCVKLSSISTDKQAYADMNDDGLINSVDALTILKISVGLK